MSFKEDVLAAFVKINAATDNIAADIRKLTEQLAGGVSAEDQAEILGKLNAHADTLEGIATTTPDGTPTPEPEPEV